MNTRNSIVLAVLFLSNGIFCGAFGEKPSTVIPVPSTLKKFMPKLHQEKLREAKNNKVDFVMIGDSITYSWSKYPGVFEGSNLLNLGFPGDRTQNVPWRIENGALDGISPKIATLMIGTNNMHDTKKAYQADKPEDIFTGIKAIVAEVRTRLPKSQLVIFSVLPRKPGSGNDRAKAVNEMIPQLADGKTVSHLDLNAFFLNENGQLNKDLYNRDLLHLNDRGYIVWGRAMYRLLKKHGLSVNPTVVGKND